MNRQSIGVERYESRQTNLRKREEEADRRINGNTTQSGEGNRMGQRKKWVTAGETSRRKVAGKRERIVRDMKGAAHCCEKEWKEERGQVFLTSKNLSSRYENECQTGKRKHRLKESKGE